MGLFALRLIITIQIRRKYKNIQQHIQFKEIIKISRINLRGIYIIKIFRRIKWLFFNNKNGS